ncbi:methionyl-tRNA formyltransferase [Motiliproteus sp. MSK22-1]|uniref:methionyl-tRNA formyltransferase n=1 Tax=Motiliproteus sp. MSK22-1 TaxID=1897630 RepID=UPI000977FA23|nr:methionyl-tRNA formyltransferase [Motiliproteus sp. MSK22-1]OMH39463.1 methionyl-tRNA formyltransferase [Motiliproteus sp. MSK22-1]
MPTTESESLSKEQPVDPLRIVFAGTPEFAAASLEALIGSEHEVVAVYTQPDRPAGRGKKLTASPVKELAVRSGINVCQPLSLKPDEEQKKLAQLNADIMVVAAYGLLLPETILNTPRLGCINVHASLLPRWRGAAPIHRSLIAGDTETGITIMQMDKGLDTGDMLLKRTCPITAEDSSGTLHDRLAEIGATALLEALGKIQSGTITAEAQDENLACYASKLLKAEGQINWTLSAEKLDRQIRGLNPWPVTYSQLNGERIRIWQAHLLEGQTDQRPGTIISADNDGLSVATGNGIIAVTSLQLPGKKQLFIADLLNARQDLFRPGNRFDIEA